MEKTCLICGKENEAGARYCAGCDAKLDVNNAFKREQSVDLSVQSHEYELSGNDEYDKKDKIELSTTIDMNEVTQKEAHFETNINREYKSNEKEPRTTVIHEDEIKDAKGLVRFNHLLCPYCGTLSKQSEFFCQNCNCDLKVAKTIPVPSGKLDEYSHRYKTRALDFLVGKDFQNVDGQFKRFLNLSSNRNIDASTWKAGKNMRLEASGQIVPKSAHVFIALIIMLFAQSIDLPFASFLMILVPVGLAFIQKKVFLAGEDEVVILTDKGIDIIREVGNSTEKVREILWEHIDQIAIVGQGNNQQLRLESADLSHTCLIPRFAPKKRAMMLNTFGIIANRNQYKVYFENKTATSSLEASV